MKNVSTGFGLCVLGLGIAAWPVLDRLAPSANASAVTAAAAAVSTSASGQTGPTIVWYGIGSDPTVAGSGYGPMIDRVYRAWSDGTVEMRRVNYAKFVGGNFRACDDGLTCLSPWMVVSSPAQGLTYRSDINFDEKVDGADLGQLLADWGNAPRQDISSSDCPLGLINP